VQGVDGAAQGGFVAVRPIHGSTDEPFVEDLGSDVEDALAEAAAVRGATVVDDMRWQDRDPLAAGSAVTGLQVVANPAVVHDAHRPRVVHVGRVGVVDEAGVEDLVNARDHRFPRPDPLRCHGKIVQDRAPAAVVHCGHEQAARAGWPRVRRLDHAGTEQRTALASGMTVVSRPLGVLHAAAFQFANPKAWLFGLTAVGTFLPRHLAPIPAALVVAATSAVIILGTAAAWAAGGAALNRIVDGGPAQRAVSLALALVLAASVALIWL